MTMDYYRGMLIQTTRVEAFQRHLSQLVRPDDRVLEIGAGLGTYSFFAAEAGAAKVWAVEGAPVINVAKSIAQVNGYGDRVEFLRGWFPGVNIPEPIDLLIFEDFSPRLLDQWTFSVLKELHTNVLKPGARVVPDRARMFLAPVFVPQNWRLIGAFGGDDDASFGIDWYPSREYIYNTPLGMPLAADDLRHDPYRVTEIDLHRMPSAHEIAGHAEWTFDRATTLHGLAYWFELRVGDTWLSNAPGADPGSWGNLYLPVSEPLEIKAGETLRAGVGVDVGSDGTPGWLHWEVETADTRFRGHEFKSFPASLEDLLPVSPAWVPELSEQGKTESRVLALADGTRSVEEIATALAGTDTALDKDAIRALVINALSGRTTESPKAATS